MDLTLYNTLSRTKEIFTPLKSPRVTLYTCGPTVHGYAHIGNLRAYVFADILRRALEFFGFEVKQIINVTDIGHLLDDGDDGEDKMTRALKREGKPLTLEAMRELAEFYFARFQTDLKKLNVSPPAAFPFASDHIKEDIALVERLLKRDYAYRTSDGIYFDTGRFPDYERLRGGDAKDESKPRIKINREKRDLKDFALWKFSSDSGLGYDAPFGRGFPGWHVECSAMAMKYLGETIDLHTGGIDHIPVHHTNERAQSEAATGQTFARFWLHSAFVTIHDLKMAKSEGNIIILDALDQQGVSPLAYRYWLLMAHYRTTMAVSWEALRGANQALNRLHAWWQHSELKGLEEKTSLAKQHFSTPLVSDYRNKFFKAIADDLNTPQALATLWDLIKDQHLNFSDKRELVLDFDKILGLDFSSLLKIEIPAAVRKLLVERETARQKPDWPLADRLRDQILKLGFRVNDTPDGPIVYLS